MAKKFIFLAATAMFLIMLVLVAQLYPQLFFGGELFATPQLVHVSYEITGTPERIDNTYLKAKVKWVLSITTDKAMCISGYLLDVDKLINDAKLTYNGKPITARKNIDIKIYPKPMIMNVPLMKYEDVTVAESKSGYNAVVVGDTTKDVPVTTSPLKLNYYLSLQERGAEYQYPFDVELYVQGGGTTRQTFEVYTSQSIMFLDGKVVITKLGNFVGDVDIPKWDNLIFIPLSNNAPSLAGEVKDANGNRWLILKDGNFVATRLINKDSPTSFNAYFWEDDQHVKASSSYLEIWFPGVLESMLRSITQSNMKPAPGTGMVLSVYLNSLAVWTSGVTYWGYPRQPSFFTPLEAISQGNYTEQGAWRVEYEKSGYFDSWKVFRWEGRAEAFFPWLLKQTTVYNPTGMNPLPKEWKIENNYVKIAYPPNQRPQALKIEIDGSLADTVIIDPLVSSFKFADITKSSDTVKGGQTMTIDVKVKNTGSLEGTATIVAKSNVVNLDMKSATITLKPDETDSVKFSIFYGGSDSGIDDITFELYNSIGELQDKRTVSIQYAAPIGGLYLGTPYIEGGAAEYGKTVTLCVPVINKQSVTYRSITVRVIPPGGFSVERGEETKDVSASETIFRFRISTLTTSRDYIGTFTIQLIKDGEVIDSIPYSVTANQWDGGGGGGGGDGKKDWLKQLAEKVSLLIIILIIIGIILITTATILSWLGVEKMDKVLYAGIVLIAIGVMLFLILSPSLLGSGLAIGIGVFLIVLSILLFWYEIGSKTFLGITIVFGIALIVVGVVALLFFI